MWWDSAWSLGRRHLRPGARAVEALQEVVVEFAPGLTSVELLELEIRFGLTFAPDHYWMLRSVLPVGNGWPDWRSGDPDELRALINRPVEDIAAMVRDDGWWWEPWGDQPTDLDQAERAAREHLATVPRLVPIYEQHYMPSTPRESGNPVLAWDPGDLTVFSTNLGEYVARRQEQTARTHRAPRHRVRFWSDLADHDNPPA